MATKSRITDARCETFYAELHALLIAGLDFSHAFALLIGDEREGRMKSLAEGLYDEVVRGAALWQAMEHSGAFRTLDYGVVRIGEQTGRLADTLDFLAEYYRKRIEQRRMVCAAVSYPLVILATAVAVVSFMLLVVVPLFEQVYTRMGGELPGLTRRIIALAEAMPSIAAAIAGAGLVLGILYYRNRHRKEVEAARDGLLLRMPLAGALVRQSTQAQCCKLLCLLTRAGVPLLTGVGMLAEVIGSHPYRTSLDQIARTIERGGAFWQALERFPKLYDRKLVALVRVGEQTGRLAEMLHRQGDALTLALEYRIKRLGSLLEPALILLVGLLVAVILISMYLPMFRLGGVMG